MAVENAEQTVLQVEIRHKMMLLGFFTYRKIWSLQSSMEPFLLRNKFDDQQKPQSSLLFNSPYKFNIPRI